VEDGEATIPAPGPGQSIERLFSATGVLLDARITDTPTPGVPPAPPLARDTEAAPGARDALSGIEGLAPAWAVLIALAGGLLLGAAAARAASVVRGRDVEA